MHVVTNNKDNGLILGLIDSYGMDNHTKGLRKTQTTVLWLEQRSIIRCYVVLCKLVSDIIVPLNKVYGSSALKTSHIYKWKRLFQEGLRASVLVEHWPGHPVTAKTDDNVAKVLSLLQGVSENLEISCGRINDIIKSDLPTIMFVHAGCPGFSHESRNGQFKDGKILSIALDILLRRSGISG